MNKPIIVEEFTVGDNCIIAYCHLPTESAIYMFEEVYYEGDIDTIQFSSPFGDTDVPLDSVIHVGFRDTIRLELSIVYNKEEEK